MNELIFYFFYNFAYQAEVADRLILFVAEPFPYIVILSAGVFLFFYQKDWLKTALVFCTVAFAWLVSYGMKNLFQTARPFDAFPDVISLFSETGYAFPSGHATFFMALGVAIFLVHKKAGAVFIFFAILIGLARIAAGVHHPVDILGGFILGAFLAWAIHAAIVSRKV